MDADENNVPANLHPDLAQEKPNAGYPERIDHKRLWNVRQHLLWLLETTWDEVGWTLGRVKNAAQLQAAVKPWQARIEQEEHVVKSLLRLSESPATGTLLDRQRKQQGKLHSSVLSAHDQIGKCWESLERFMQIPSMDLPDAERNVICDAIRMRARKLAQAGAEYIALTNEEKDLEQLIRNGEAYFARKEFARFCRSQRYRLNPVNVANALAGLPFIGCRQSVKRCRKWPADGSGGLSYQIFQILRRIVQANTRRPDLIKDAERWLRSRRAAESSGVSELQLHWYYLRRSIKTALDQNTSRPQLPAAISREYWRRKSHPSAIDRAFAEEEQILR
jgi:hypothetical protein